MQTHIYKGSTGSWLEVAGAHLSWSINPKTSHWPDNVWCRGPVRSSRGPGGCAKQQEHRPTLVGLCLCCWN